MANDDVGVWKWECGCEYERILPGMCMCLAIKVMDPDLVGFVFDII